MEPFLGLNLGDNGKVSSFLKNGRFFMVKWPIFGRFSPNLDPRRPKCRQNYKRPCLGPLSGHFFGGVNFGTTRKKIGPLLGPLRGHVCHTSIFLQKIFFSARLVLWPSRTAKKATKGPRACFCTCGSALATASQLSTPDCATRQLGGHG